MLSIAPQTPCQARPRSYRPEAPSGRAYSSLIAMPATAVAMAGARPRMALSERETDSDWKNSNVLQDPGSGSRILNGPEGLNGLLFYRMRETPCNN